MSEQQVQFSIQRIYVKDTSFEAPNLPGLFREAQDWRPEINMDLNTSSSVLEEGTHEVVLSLTVTAKLADKTAFLVEIQQAGIFQAAGLDNEQLAHTLGAYCPNILYPYAREAVSSLTARGGFPPLHLAPVNFDALYAQHLQQRAGGQPN